MKTIRIVLFILIIVGIVALATQKLWVPKLVNYIIASESKQTIPQEDQPNITLKDGRQCYTYNHEATKDEPYTVNEFIDMAISGTKVIGTKTGTQKGPDMTNGYTGTLIGISDKNTITVVYSYTVEGSKNKEEEIYRTNKVGIEKLRYPLVEDAGILVPDTTKEFKTMTYARVECIGSN